MAIMFLSLMMHMYHQPFGTSILNRRGKDIMRFLYLHLYQWGPMELHCHDTDPAPMLPFFHVLRLEGVLLAGNFFVLLLCINFLFDDFVERYGDVSDEQRNTVVFYFPFLTVAEQKLLGG
jgi:hypothetical protein